MQKYTLKKCRKSLRLSEDEKKVNFLLKLNERMQEYAKIMLDECHLRFEEYRQDKASSVNSETVPRKRYPGDQRFFLACDKELRFVGRRPKTRAAKPREKTFRAGHFLRLDRNRKPHIKSLWHPG